MYQALDLDPSKPLDLTLLEGITETHHWVLSWWLLIPFAICVLAVLPIIVDEYGHSVRSWAGGLAAGVALGTAMTVACSWFLGFTNDEESVRVANEKSISAWAEGRYGIDVNPTEFREASLPCDADTEDCAGEKGMFRDTRVTVEFMLDDGTIVTNKIVGHQMILVKSGGADELPLTSDAEGDR